MTQAEAAIGEERRELPRYLVDVVEEVCALWDSATLRHVVRRFGRRSRVAVESTEPVARRPLLVQLMEEMCDQQEGLAPLVRHLEVREGNTTGIQRLKVAVAAWEVELFTVEEWNEIFLLLDEVHVPDLRRWYADFLHCRGRASPPTHCTEPWSVFLHAATLNARPGQSLPCFDVLRQLALVADGEQHLALADWADAHDLALTPQGAEHEPAEKTAAPLRTDVWSPTSYVIIRLRHLLDSDGDTDILLSYWWRVHPGEQQRGKDRRITLGQAEKAVRALIHNAESEWAYLRSDIAVEFLLPRVLLDLGVERWRKTAFQGVGGVLGEDHHVVLRSLDRHDRRDLHGRWGSRWRAFTEGNAGRVHWFPEDGRAHLLSEPPPAVVVLSEAPGSAQGDAWAHGRTDELGEALRAGVPIVLWDRRGLADPAFRAELRDLLERHDLRTLPGVVKALRIATADRDAEANAVVGRHVALLWDDPDRMPVGPPSNDQEAARTVVEEGQ
ncbi:hypothetical protein J7F01_13270 [Streptomyces sp. ISL-22]|uniref:VMAP-C domain-containing protein n=1 Tax=unclassified Streptomyces TaxID=2593676 RepID=UPI001BE5C317|nr:MULTISPECIES: hypothetical protein [unclassified Streptomyces]MBT2420242.1 hypothetical protein [Streptomyces sp. ISL-24]MBT2433144.1 hypothetical protein [Streptomyces sp. ISL-22]